MAKKRPTQEVEVLQLPGMLVGDAQEFFYWIAWKVATGQYVPYVIAELADWIGEELGLEPEKPVEG